MPSKDVYLFDSSNNPLKVPGIHVELCEVATGTMLAADLSHDLDPPKNVDWGVRLNFPVCAGPLDIYFADPNYRYPGNTVRNLNGQLPDRLDVDLLQAPVAPGGQSYIPQPATPANLLGWIEEGYRWSSEEKRAVRNLIFNYINVVVAQEYEFPDLKERLYKIADNWEEALRRLELPPELLHD